VGLQIKPVESGTNRPTAFVHECGGHQQAQAPLALTQVGDLSFQPGVDPETGAFGLGQTLQGHEADVVASLGIAAARIPQPHQQLEIPGGVWSGGHRVMRVKLSRCGAVVASRTATATVKRPGQAA